VLDAQLAGQCDFERLDLWTVDEPLAVYDAGKGCEQFVTKGSVLSL
jgi:hypothetical protein